MSRLSLRTRFILLIAMMGAGISIGENIASYRTDVRLYKEGLASRITAIATVIGSNATAAIQFQDDEAAGELLQALRHEPSVRAAFIVNSQNREMARYVAPGLSPAIRPLDTRTESLDFRDDGMTVLHPIKHDEEVIGAIFIDANLQKLEERKAIRLRVGLQIMFVIILLCIVLAVWAQRYFVAPIRDLARLAEKIGREKLFSHRVSGNFSGELGVLASNFNFMLSELESREEELRKRTEQLRSSNEQLEQFANIAAHDLQEPLRKARSYADRLVTKCRGELSEQGKEYLDRMDRSVERMQTLVNDLLEFSRIKSRAKPFSPTDLTGVVDTVVSDLQIRISELSGKVEVGKLPTIDADAIQIGQLMQNLIANGLKFHRKSEPPVVTVSSRVLEGKSSGTDEPAPRQPQCEIVVEDNGIGFDEKYLDRIFQPFQRLHGREEYPGTGMGLAICRRIVERHSGTITARSVPEKGTKFIVTLPVRQLKKEFAADTGIEH